VRQEHGELERRPARCGEAENPQCGAASMRILPSPITILILLYLFASRYRAPGRWARFAVRRRRG
jgi:hypothetical protein